MAGAYRGAAAAGYAGARGGTMWWTATAWADAPVEDAPIPCERCEAWNAPRAPFRVVGETFYVGPEGLSVLAIDTGDGVILLDGALPQSVSAIEANLAAVGLALADVAYIAVSHAHYDHVGGVAALQRRSGAVVLASPEAAAALRAGGVLATDPQAGFGAEANTFPAVADVREVADGEVVRLGDVSLTAVWTPGHTTGGTSWTWQDCEEGRCVDVVYADSLNAVASPGFRFADGTGDVLARSIERVGGLPCGVLVSVHPEFSSLFERADRGRVVDDRACLAYAGGAAKRLKARLKDEARSTR